MKGIVQLRGDYGNPKDTGLSKLVVEDLESADVPTGLTDMDTFADGLKTDGFTACNVGDVTVSEITIQFQDKPGANVNVDRQLVCHFRKKTDNTVRKLTISGVPYTTGANFEGKPGGERISEAGKTALEARLDTLFGWTDEAVVLSGKVLQKQ